MGVLPGPNFFGSALGYAPVHTVSNGHSPTLSNSMGGPHRATAWAGLRLQHLVLQNSVWLKCQLRGEGSSVPLASRVARAAAMASRTAVWMSGRRTLSSFATFSSFVVSK